MASARAMLERRRATRLWTRIPVHIFSSEVDGALLDDVAQAISVSRCGALLRTSLHPDIGSRITLHHAISGRTRECRVIRISGPGKDGRFEVGIEIFYPEQDFWGLQFPGDREPA